MNILFKSVSYIRENGILTFLNVIIESAAGKNVWVDRLFFRLSVLKLRRFQKKEGSIEDIVDTAQNFRGLGFYKSINPSQVEYEYIEALKEIENLDPDIVMEIGSKSGGTMYGWCRVGSPELMISIDLPEGEFGGGYPQQKGKFYKRFHPSTNIELIRGNSHSENIKDDAEKILDGREVDFLFVDGDHTYEGVKQDFEMYKELVGEGGIIAFHDILEHPEMENCNVDKFWNEIKDNYRTKEIYEERQQGWAGIGLVYLD